MRDFALNCLKAVGLVSLAVLIASLLQFDLIQNPDSDSLAVFTTTRVE